MDSTSQQDAGFSEAFRTESGALRRLARSLVRDAASADDVVQDTWTAYLSRPPADAAELGGFLGVLTRRLAWKARRGEARRKERERLAARAVLQPGPDELAERASALREVLDALATLREPYRRALWQRFFDDLPPREIARASGESVATIKSRLQRGLELLRAELDRRHGGRRSDWAVVLLPFAAASTGALGFLVSGGFLMSSTLKLTAAALVIAAVGGFWFWSSRGDTALALPELATSANSPKSLPNAGEVQDASAGARSAVADAAPPADPPLVVDPELAHPYLYVLVARVRDEYGLLHDHPDLRLAPVRSAMNIAQSIAEVDGVSTLIWRGKEPEMDVDVQFGGANRMRGSKRVHVRAGMPNEIALFGPSALRGPIVTSGSEFKLTLRARLVETELDALSDDALRMVRFPHPHARFGDRFVQREAKPVVPKEPVESIVLEEGASEVRVLAGRIMLSDSISTKPAPSEATSSRVSIHVVDEQGEPAKGVLVALGAVIDGLQGGHTFTDEHGDAVLERVAGGWYEARAGGGDGGLVRERLFVEAPNELHWNARLERGARVFGHVVIKEGETPTQLAVRFESTPDVVARGTTVRVTMETQGGEEISEHGEARESGPGEIRAPWVDQALVREDGTFELDNLPPGIGRLLVLKSPGPEEHALAVVDSVLPGEREWVLADPLAERAQWGVIVMRLQLPVAVPEDRIEVRAISEATGRGATLGAGKDGLLSSAALAPGWYKVELGAGCLGWHDLGRQYVEAGARVDLGTFAPPLPASVRVVPPAPVAGQTAPLELTFYLRRPDLDVRGEPRSIGGSQLLYLPAGDYWAFWNTGDGVTHHRGLKLEAGSTAELDLR